MIRVEVCVDARSFLDRAEAFLRAREDEYAVILGIALGLAEGTRTTEDAFFEV